MKVDPQNASLANGAATVRLTVGATSNVPVSLAITYEGPANATVSGPATVSIPLTDKGHANETVTVSIRSTRLEAGSHEVRIRARGEAGDGTGEGSATVSLSVSPVDPLSGVGTLVPVAAVAAIGAGAIVWGRRR